MPTDPDAWRRGAACRDVDTNVFFPSREHPDGRPRRETSRSYREARLICTECPVRLPCLEHALEVREPDGMWGGLTRPERAKLLRSRRQAARAARSKV